MMCKRFVFRVSDVLSFLIFEAPMTWDGPHAFDTGLITFRLGSWLIKNILDPNQHPRCWEAWGAWILETIDPFFLPAKCLWCDAGRISLEEVAKMTMRVLRRKSVTCSAISGIFSTLIILSMYF